MNHHVTRPLSRRRQPTARTWVAFSTALAAVLVLLGLIAAEFHAQLTRPADGAAVGTTAGSDVVRGLGVGDTAGQTDPSQASGVSTLPAPAPAPPPPPPPVPPPPSPPVIEYFQVVQQPSCPGGTTQFPVDGVPVGLEWRVTGATEVTLSVDGPGVYGTYPAESGAVIAFPCAGSPGDLQTHTYLLTATANGTTVTDTLTVTATVDEITEIALTTEA